ncbi:MAG: hypothetical protein P1V51_00300 [Deltaproteobacteria bacterium]|nr:hypothetical protein [Deltaproteobacteria bacterium]
MRFTAPLLALLALTAACNEPVSLSRPAAPAETAAPAEAATPRQVVKRVVFVGKQGACDCTKAKVEASWAALQQTLGTPAKLPVEKLQIDVDGPQVAFYQQQKPILALPAIYLIDETATVVELLQGEVTADQLTAALKH